LEDSNIYANLNFYLGKDLSEDVKEDLTLYIKECQGYYHQLNFLRSFLTNNVFFFKQ